MKLDNELKNWGEGFRQEPQSETWHRISDSLVKPKPLVSILSIMKIAAVFLAIALSLLLFDVVKLGNQAYNGENFTLSSLEETSADNIYARDKVSLLSSAYSHNSN